MTHQFSEATAIVGVGITEVERDPQTTDSLAHIFRAIKAAIADAGLEPADIDGIVPSVVPAELAMDQAGEYLGLANVRYSLQYWSHGRMEPMKLAQAALALQSGLANYILFFGEGMDLQGYRARYAHGASSANPENARIGLGPHMETPVYGNTAIQGGAALSTSKYLKKYGYDEADLGQIAVAQRKWGAMNPNAYFFGKPITLDDYMAARYITKPLRLLDCSIPGNAGFAMVLCNRDRAMDAPKPPVYISGYQGSVSGREHHVFSRTGLGMAQQSEAPYRAPDMGVYRMAGVDRADIDILGALDVFTPIAAFALEEFGFVGEGEALSFIGEGRTSPGGELPMNTSGGGQGHVNGAGRTHITELVMQLRGEAGERQVKNAKLGQYITTDRSSIILRSD